MRRRRNNHPVEIRQQCGGVLAQFRSLVRQPRSEIAWRAPGQDRLLSNTFHVGRQAIDRFVEIGLDVDRSDRIAFELNRVGDAHVLVLNPGFPARCRRSRRGCVRSISSATIGREELAVLGVDRASDDVRFGAQRTMRVAQGLYEGVTLGEEGAVGLITYMRTDSFALAPEAVAEARAFIDREYGKEYVPETPPVYKRGKQAVAAQEAHEAIRPSSVERTPESVARYLDPDQLRLYRLIWQRFVACQMVPARFMNMTVEVGARAPSTAEGEDEALAA